MRGLYYHSTQLHLHLQHLVEKQKEQPGFQEILWMVKIPCGRHKRAHQYRLYGRDASKVAKFLDQPTQQGRNDEFHTLCISSGHFEQTVQQLVHDQFKVGILDLGHQSVNGWQPGWMSVSELTSPGEPLDAEDEEFSLSSNEEFETSSDDEDYELKRSQPHFGTKAIQTLKLRLHAIYSKGTFTSLINGHLTSTNLGRWTENETNFFCCLIEDNGSLYQGDSSTRIALILVGTTNREIYYDEFDDDSIRYELAQRLHSVRVVEFLVVGKLSASTEQFLHQYRDLRSNSSDKGPARDDIEKPKQFHASLRSGAGFYSRSEDRTASKGPKSEAFTSCLSALITRFEQCGLAWLLRDWNSFQPLSNEAMLIINRTTADQLELFRNRKDFTSKHTLFDCLQRPTTIGGQRELRAWLARPLTDEARIHERHLAVKELKEDHFKQQFVLSKLKEVGYVDLDRFLTRIMSGKCNAYHFLKLLKILRQASESASRGNPPSFIAKMNRECIEKLTQIQPLVSELLGGFVDLKIVGVTLSKHTQIVEDIVRGHTLLVMQSLFKSGEGSKAILSAKRQLDDTQEELLAHRARLANEAGSRAIEFLLFRGKGSDLIYVSDINFRRPKSWHQVLDDQGSYYLEPKLTALSQSYYNALQALEDAEQEEVDKRIEKVVEHRALFSEVIRSLEFLDCIHSLAVTAVKYGWTMPTFSTNTSIDICGFQHPILLAQLNKRQGSQVIANDLCFSQNDVRCALLTGPNASGKTCLSKSVALCLILAQMGSFVPAISARLCIVDGIYVRMGAYDNLTKGQSTFMVELVEANNILRSATERSLVIFDELGRGSSTRDGLAIAQSVLEYVVKKIKCFTIFITHHQGLMTSVDSIVGLQHYTMEFTPMQKDAEHSRIIPNYKLVKLDKGRTLKSHGLAILATEIAAITKARKERSLKKPEKDNDNNSINNAKPGDRIKFMDILTVATRRAEELEHDIRMKRKDAMVFRMGLKILEQALDEYPDATKAL